MKICFIGKYPPIEGGVSAQNYWAARALASRGHHVYVITNADEVEDHFRQRLTANDAADYEPLFPDTGGFVKVVRPEPFTPRRMSHIPVSNPFVSKLAGLATQVVRTHSCDLIVAYYFEPYVVAGHLAATWTGVPMLIEHAGSDLDRLMRLPELATVYKEIIRSAAAVVTKPSLAHRFLGMGVRRDALRLGPPYPLPRSIFNANAVPMTAAEIGESSIDGFGSRFEPGLPTIGMYGKPGGPKGTFDLIKALSIAAGSGLRFNALFLSGHSQLDRMRAEIQAGGLTDRTAILPFLPPWHVPRFIRTCTAVCFLERDFPVSIHGPTVPREILACGTCLVLSQEILGKQSYRHRLVDQHNVLVIDDPKEHEKLAVQLEIAIRTPHLAQEIGAHGGELASDFDDFDTFADAWESLVEVPNTTGRPMPRPRTLAELIEDMLPSIAALLGESMKTLVAQFAAEYIETSDFATAEAFCDHLDTLVESVAVGAGISPAYLSDVVRYQRARLWASQDGPDDRDPYAGTKFTFAELKPMVARLSTSARIETFDHNVTAEFCQTPELQGLDQGGRISSGAQNAITICFTRQPNLDHGELRLNVAAHRLIGLCDGRRSITEIIDELAPASDQDVLEALIRLRTAGVVVLGPS